MSALIEAHRGLLRAFCDTHTTSLAASPGYVVSTSCGVEAGSSFSSGLDSYAVMWPASWSATAALRAPPT